MANVKLKSVWLIAQSVSSQQAFIVSELREAFYWAEWFICAASITYFKEGAGVSWPKRIMIITLRQGTLTSWKWMGLTLWELWREGSSCLGRVRRRTDLCSACGHAVCSCVLIRRNQSRINDQTISVQCTTVSEVWLFSKIISQRQTKKGKRKFKSYETLKWKTCRKPSNWAPLLSSVDLGLNSW